MSSYLSELIQFLVGYAGDYQLNHWMNKSVYICTIYSGVREKRKEKNGGTQVIGNANVARNRYDDATT